MAQTSTEEVSEGIRSDPDAPFSFGQKKEAVRLPGMNGLFQFFLDAFDHHLDSKIETEYMVCMRSQRGIDIHCKENDTDPSASECITDFCQCFFSGNREDDQHVSGSQYILITSYDTVITGIGSIDLVPGETECHLLCRVAGMILTVAQDTTGMCCQIPDHSKFGRICLLPQLFNA